MRGLAIGSVLALLASSGAGAAEARGAGATELCSTYLVETSTRSPKGQTLQQWTLAFVTGYMGHVGMTDDDPTAKMSNEDVLRSIATYCGKQPTSRLVDALTTFSYAASIANKKYDAGKR